MLNAEGREASLRKGAKTLCGLHKALQSWSVQNYPLSYEVLDEYSFNTIWVGCGEEVYTFSFKEWFFPKTLQSFVNK